MTTSIIIPAYFAHEDLIWTTTSCLASLKYGQPDETIVVDDGSPLDVTPPADVMWVRNPKNRGYAGAVNTGLAKANGEVLIVSNNDIVFTPGWLEAILKPLKEGFDISTIRTTDGDGWLTQDKTTEGDKFGSLWAMTRKVYDTLGGLDESFGNYFEDLDYRRRAIQAGFKIGKNHRHLVEHEGKATFKLVDPDNHFYREAKQKYWDKWEHLDRKVLADDFKGDPDFAHLLVG